MTNRLSGFTHEVTRQGIISMREDLLVGMSKDDFPWWIKTIDDKKDIVINDIAQMPEEAAAEQKIVMLQDVKSLLVIPIFFEGNINGFIGLDSVKKYRNWTALDIGKPENAYRYHIDRHRTRDGARDDGTFYETGFEK